MIKPPVFSLFVVFIGLYSALSIAQEVINPGYEAYGKNGSMCGEAPDWLYCPDDYLCYVASGYNVPFYCFHRSINIHRDPFRRVKELEAELKEERRAGHERAGWLSASLALPLVALCLALTVSVCLNVRLRRSIELFKRATNSELSTLKITLLGVENMLRDIRTLVVTTRSPVHMPPSTRTPFLDGRSTIDIGSNVPGTSTQHYKPPIPNTQPFTRQNSTRRSARQLIQQRYEDDYGDFTPHNGSRRGSLGGQHTAQMQTNAQLQQLNSLLLQLPNLHQQAAATLNNNEDGQAQAAAEMEMDEVPLGNDETHEPSRHTSV